MGCLFEIFLEGVTELFLSLYLKISLGPIPDKRISPKMRARVEGTVTVISVLLMLTLLVGLFLFAVDFGSGALRTVGAYMTFVSLGIIVLQILLSLAVLIRKAWKK